MVNVSHSIKIGSVFNLMDEKNQLCKVWT